MSDRGNSRQNVTVSRFVRPAVVFPRGVTYMYVYATYDVHIRDVRYLLPVILVLFVQFICFIFSGLTVFFYFPSCLLLSVSLN